jgi:hypothetical protein
MALGAIVRWFGGHQTWFRWLIHELMAACVVSCAWKSTVLVRTLTKNPTKDKPRSNLAQLTFFKRSLSDLKVSFVNKYQCLLCRAWSALSKTVLTLI